MGPQVYHLNYNRVSQVQSHDSDQQNNQVVHAMCPSIQENHVKKQWSGVVN